MSGNSFRSLFMVASCAGAALSCYLVSLRVASERSALEDVENRIVMAQRDLRLIQTEIGTRGRLAQLERWNASVLALSAPSHDQFLQGSFELARLARPDDKVDFEAPVVLAAAPKQDDEPKIDGDDAPPSTSAPAASGRALMHVASLKTETREVPAKKDAKPPVSDPKSTDRPATAAKPVISRSADKPGLAAAKSTAGASAKVAPAADAKKAAVKTADAKPKPATAEAKGEAAQAR